MKKAFALLLCLIMSLSLLAACGGNNTDTGATKGTDPNGRPIITIGLPENSNVNYDNNSYTKLIEDLAGVKIEFEFFQGLAGDYCQQFSLRVASNEKLPDIIWGFNGMSQAARYSYGEDGVFIDLTDYFEDEEKSAIFWERLATWPESEQERVKHDMVYQYTGEIYAYPSVLYAEVDTCTFMPFINKKWLDNVGKKMPTNIEELEDVLRAFRDQDPNQDGKKNDIPCLVQSNGTGAQGLSYLINLFTYFRQGYDPFKVDDNGKLQCIVTSQEYRDALIWINRMVSEGLINKQSFTAGSNEIKQFFATEGMDRLGMTVVHPEIGMSGATDAIMNWVPLELINYAPIAPAPHLYCTMITRDCENVDAAWKVLCAMTTREAQLHSILGEFGEDWTWADEDGLTVRGEKAEVKYIGAGDTLPTDDRWLYKACGVETPMYIQKRDDADASPKAVYKQELPWKMYEIYVAAAEKNNPPAENICPNLDFNKEDQQDAPGFTAVQNLMSEWRVKFMEGQKNPASEADWNEYLSALDQAGYDAYYEVAQIIYDREFKDTGLT